MITKTDNTINNLKNLFLEVLLNKTDKVSDITDNSVLNGVAYGVAKVAQKAIKDVAIVETQIFPETASGDWLDRAASLFGVTARKTTQGSSAYVCVFANPGTVYDKDMQVFTNTNGVRFRPEETVVVGDYGYAYIKVRSVGEGAYTNVAANSILRVAPVPIGHIACTNEYYAQGGCDEEDDDMFRRRILNHQNLFATATLEKITQVFQNFDDRVLKILWVGVMEDGFLHIEIATQNGQDLSEEERSTLLEQATPYFGLSDFISSGHLMGIKLDNVQWYEVGGETGLDFRCELEAGYEVADVRRRIQIGITKYLDWRYWTAGSKVEWDNILEIVKATEGVKYVASEWFYPNEDEYVSEFMLPRVKRFIMRNLDGTVMVDSSTSTTVEQRYNELFPAYYAANN